MNHEKRLREEIQGEFERYEEENRCVPKEWLVTSVLGKHQDVQGPDSEFALYCTAVTVRNGVESFFRRIKSDETLGDDQMLLEGVEGFAYIKKRYLVSRDGDSVGVPVGEMTSDEMDAKADELDAFAAGCRMHAIELRKLAKDRRKAEAAGAGTS